MKSHENEIAVVGGLLLRPDRIEGVGALLNPADFASSRPRAIFTALLALHNRGEPLDAGTVASELERNGWSSSDALAAIDQIISATPTAANLEYHVRKVQEAAQARRLQDALQRASQAIEQGEGPGAVGARLRELGALVEVEPGRGDHPLTEAGNAERFANEHGEFVRYCWERSTWLVWDNRRWKADHQGHGRDPGPLVMERAKETARGISADALRLGPDDSRRRCLLAWGASSERERGLLAMLSLARSLPALVAPVAALDADPFLLNVNNGTLDLRTGELRPHSKSDMITKISPVFYDPAAKSQLWESFLKTATSGDAALGAFLQRVIGYCLTGSTREEKLFLLLGPGATGKSTFVAAVKNVLGEYGATADFETFLARRAQGGPRPELTKLVGKRAVVSLEVDRGKHLAEGLVKTLVGGDTVAARDLYSRPFEFAPMFKLLLVCNDPPRARADDGAMWRRIIRVPFECVVPEADRDPDLKIKLLSPDVASAVLAWAVAGCLAWQRHGLMVPDAVAAATQALRASMNPLAGFLDDCCLLSPGCRTPAGELRAAYESWCMSNREEPLSPRAMAASLEAAGCRASKSMSTRFWNGIGLLDAASTQTEIPQGHEGHENTKLSMRARVGEFSSLTSLASLSNPDDDAGGREEGEL